MNLLLYQDVGRNITSSFLMQSFAFWKDEEIEDDKTSGMSRVIQGSGQEKKVIPIRQGELTIGRTSENDITLDEPYISRRHARVFLEGGACFIEDTKSKLGVLVNGRKISKIRLKKGDEIRLSSVRITFVEGAKEKAKNAMASVDSDATVVHTPEPMYKLVAISKNGEIAEHTFTDEGLMIGRSETSEVKLEDKIASRRHARIWHSVGRIFIEDLGSNNGTFLDGRRIPKGQKVEVLHRQVIKIASYRLLVVDRMQKIDKSLFPEEKLAIKQKIKRFWGR